MSSRNFLLILLTVLAVTVAARGSLYKCRAADGRTVLRDRQCLAGEQTVEQVRSKDVPRQFTIAKPPPAGQPAPNQAASKKTLPSEATP